MTTAIIVILAIVVIVAAFLAYRAGKKRELDGRRTEAHELRETAQTHDRRAEREQAEADRQAARARKAEAEAQEKSAIARAEAVAAQERAEVAEREGGLAREHHDRARAIDPDRDDDPRGDDAERIDGDGTPQADPAFTDRRGTESRR